MKKKLHFQTIYFFVLVMNLAGLQAINAQFSLRDDINTGSESSYPTKFIAYGDNIYFSAFTEEYKRELYKLNKNAGIAERVSDLKYAGATNFPVKMVISDHWLFVNMRDDDHGTELWSLDLNDDTSSLELVEDICPGICSYWYNEIVPDGNGRVYFVQWNHANYGTELWYADYSKAELVDEIIVGPESSEVSNLIFYDSVFFFNASLPNKKNYEGLYQYTPGGGIDLVSAPNEDFAPKMYEGVQGPDVFYFSARQNPFGFELWFYNKGQGISLVKNINATGEDQHSFPINPTGSQMIYQKELFFMADDGIHGNELWKTITVSGEPIVEKDAKMVKDIHQGNGDADIQMLGIYNNELYFRATDGTGGELWKTDGTEGGTVMVKDISLKLGDNTIPVMIGVIDGLMYFYADDHVHGNELWVTDGTEENTKMVADLWPGEKDGFDRGVGFAVLDGSIYFRSGADTTKGYEIWVYKPGACVSLSVELGADTTITVNDNLVLNGPVGMDTYLWSTGETTQNITLNGSSLGSGTHNITLTVTKDSCTADNEIVVTVDETNLVNSLIFSNLSEILLLVNSNTRQITLERVNDNQKAMVSIFGITGNKISDQILLPRQSKLNINYSNIPEGIYLISYIEITTGKSVTHKILIE